MAGLLQAQDLGQVGEVVGPGRDGREQIKDRVRSIPQKNLDEFWRSFREKNLEAIVNPKPLGVKTDFRMQQQWHDLVFEMPFDAKDAQGKVLMPKGTKIRPLDISPPATGLILIDGRDQRQVAYALAQKKIRPLKIVLTAGSPVNLHARYKAEFFFDQKGMIIRQLNQVYNISIASVPAQLFVDRGADSRRMLHVIFGAGG
jgi:conjugal transfer pilus assembly protein TraW